MRTVFERAKEREMNENILNIYWFKTDYGATFIYFWNSTIKIDFLEFNFCIALK